MKDPVRAKKYGKVLCVEKYKSHGSMHPIVKNAENENDKNIDCR